MSMLETIRSHNQSVLGVGNYTPGFQAQLDFDYLCGKNQPSLKAIVTPGRRNVKLFWGEKGVLIPCFASIAQAKMAFPDINWLFHTSSSRRAVVITEEFFKSYPDATGAHIFAEGVSEIDALKLYNEFQTQGKIIIGPAGVGLLVPGYLKLGVIGGTDHRQLSNNHLSSPGSTAVISASGGMMNEIITQVVSSGSLVSFAFCVGGDRFPSTRPKDVFLLAQQDPQTKAIVYYGELGGQDEYEIVELIKNGTLTKPVICYIAGIIGEQFETPIQFGHAKALAGNKSETASAKRKALGDAGVQSANSIKEFINFMNQLPKEEPNAITNSINQRRQSSFSSSISNEKDGEYYFVGTSLTEWAKKADMKEQIMTGLLGHPPRSAETSDFFGLVFALTIDHGPQVSGAVNTIITARAGKDIVDSLAAGLLTIGPRFGGATNAAATVWHQAVSNEQTADQIIKAHTKKNEPIPGIGHKKYRLDQPDPRVAIINEFLQKNLTTHNHLNKAREVEALTLEKKPNLILNVDGIIAAGMLDILSEKEDYDFARLSSLIETGFFNALFVIPRTVGFVSHFLDQKRLDEGLFRLPDDDVSLL